MMARYEKLSLRKLVVGSWKLAGKLEIKPSTRLSPWKLRNREIKGTSLAEKMIENGELNMEDDTNDSSITF